MGTAELGVVGLLDLIVDDLVVSVSTAGLLVTSYALGMALGGPVLSALTLRFGRRALLRTALVAYVVGTGLAGLASSFELLVLARILTGSLHGLLVGVALVLAAELVGPERQGRAISVVVGGFAVATALGVPLGTFVGQALGWRAAFAVVVGLGLIATVAAFAFVQPPRAGDGTRSAGGTRAALAAPVLVLLAIGFVLMGSQFMALTYITPFLTQVTGVSGAVVGWFLLAYGTATAVGTGLGGRAADRDAGLTLVVADAILVVSLGTLWLAGSSPLVALTALVAWGAAGFGLVPALQLRVVTLAGDGADLAGTLSVSAITGGIAAGSLAGGAIIATTGPQTLVLASAAACALALPLTWLARRLGAPDRPARSGDPQQDEREAEGLTTDRTADAGAGPVDPADDRVDAGLVGTGGGVGVAVGDELPFAGVPVVLAGGADGHGTEAVRPAGVDESRQVGELVAGRAAQRLQVRG